MVVKYVLALGGLLLLAGALENPRPVLPILAVAGLGIWAWRGFPGIRVPRDFRRHAAATMPGAGFHRAAAVCGLAVAALSPGTYLIIDALSLPNATAALGSLVALIMIAVAPFAASRTVVPFALVSVAVAGGGERAAVAVIGFAAAISWLALARPRRSTW